MANVILSRVLVCLEIVRSLVNGVIGQMHVKVVQVVVVRPSVLLSSKPSETLSKDKGSQGVDSVD